MGVFDLTSSPIRMPSRLRPIRSPGFSPARRKRPATSIRAAIFLTSNYTSALQPYLQNYSQSQTGTTALMNALGLGGASGNASALSTLQNTPGYQFREVAAGARKTFLRNAAQTGTTASGATLSARCATKARARRSRPTTIMCRNCSRSLARQNTAASGIGSTYAGLGTALNANQGSLANLDWTAATGIGNANANSALANNQAANNTVNADRPGRWPRRSRCSNALRRALERRHQAGRRAQRRPAGLFLPLRLRRSGDDPHWLDGAGCREDQSRRGDRCRRREDG